MRIGGLQKISLIDFPGKVAAVVFTQGCNFRCPFCYNLKLVLPSCFQETIDVEDVMDFLATREGKLQGVVVTGGEPTLQSDLAGFLRQIKDLGFAVKLDTNGSRPAVLEQLIQQSLIDFIAMDIKAPLDRYQEVSRVNVDTSNIQRSIDLILDSGLDHQFRTTFPKPLLSEEDIPSILSMIRHDRSFRLQPFIPQQDILDTRLLDRAHYDEEEFNRLKAEWESGVAAQCVSS